MIYGPFSRGRIRTEDLGNRGFAVYGPSDNAKVGVALAGAVDVNDDGLDDLILGDADATNSRQVAAGVIYVIFGKRSGEAIDLHDFHTNTQGTQGFRIDGAGNFDLAGEYVSVVGDSNGDGSADISIGAPFAESAYVVFGKKDALPIDLLSFDLGAQGRAGYRIDPEVIDDTTYSVGWAGDVNGDGRQDAFLSLCALYYDDEGHEACRGNGWVVFGKSDPAPINVRSIRGHGFPIAWATHGNSVGLRPGHDDDLNDDGMGDIGIIRGSDAYVIFGKKDSRRVNPLRLGKGGFRIEGFDPYGPRSWLDEIVGVGDVNQDRKPDVAIGAPDAGRKERQLSGAVYVVFGKRSTGDLSLRRLQEDGYVIYGARGDIVGREGTRVT